MNNKQHRDAVNAAMATIKENIIERKTDIQEKLDNINREPRNVEHASLLKEYSKVIIKEDTVNSVLKTPAQIAADKSASDAQLAVLVKAVEAAKLNLVAAEKAVTEYKSKMAK